MPANNDYPAPTDPLIWVDVTTLIHWTRPAVGIIRVEQQLCLWLTQQRQDAIRFCRYDRVRKQFHEIDRAALIGHLQRIATRAEKKSQPGAAARLSFEERLRQKTLKSLDRLPPRARAFALNVFVRLKSCIRYLIRSARNVRQSGRAFRPDPSPSPPLDMPTGSVYVSLGLDWDYKDMAHLYQIKKTKGLKYLFFCYDIIPILQPHLCVGDVSRQFAHYFSDLAWGADLILCISQSSRRDLQSFLEKMGVPQPPCEVVRLGADILPGQGMNAEIDESIARYAQKPYILFVSTIERRKNHEILYRAYTRLAEEGIELPPLIFVGMSGWGVGELLADLAFDPRIQGRIHVLNHVSDTELAFLYQHASFTVFPSLYEGWGLPVAESLAYGKFCLCSNTSSLPEVGEEWVDYLDPWDLPAWVERLRYYITHPQEVERRNAEISAGYRPHPWRETAADIYAHAVRLQQMI
jgi:glycosyltransferase involved in cell wall biosynthesis